MAPLIFTTEEVMTEGLRLVGYKERQLNRVRRKTAVRRFKAHFGSNAKVYAELWEALQVTDIVDAKVTDPSEVDFNNYMMTLYFMKSYPTEEELSSRFGIHEQTARKWVRFYVSKIAAYIEACVIWPNDDEWNTTFIVSFDCVNFGTNETRHPTLHKDKKLFDRKGGKAGLTYEIALHLWENRVVWINGPFPPNDGGDRAIFVEEGLQAAIPEGKKSIADKIYRGCDKVALHNSLDPPEVRLFKRRARSRQESINARLKNFGVLKQRFRHKKAHNQHKDFVGDSKHQTFVHAVMVICTFQMEHGSPLFAI